MPTTEKPYKDSLVIWQDVKEGIGEPALLLEKYSDTICITQGDDRVIINYETISELCKRLNQFKKEGK
jgi:hypothetical protein